MSDSGWVSGIYTGADDGTKTVKVVAVGDATYQGTMSVTYTKYVAPENLTIKITDSSTSDVIDGTSPVVRTMDVDMKFTVEVKRGTDPATGVTVSVVAVDSTGNVAQLTETGGEYTAPTTGTGAYKVVVTASDGVKEASSSFHLYVLPSYGNVVAQIIPGST